MRHIWFTFTFPVLPGPTPQFSFSSWSSGSTDSAWCPCDKLQCIIWDVTFRRTHQNRSSPHKQVEALVNVKIRFLFRVVETDLEWYQCFRLSVENTEPHSGPQSSRFLGVPPYSDLVGPMTNVSRRFGPKYFVLPLSKWLRQSLPEPFFQFEQHKLDFSWRSQVRDKHFLLQEGKAEGGSATNYGELLIRDPDENAVPVLDHLCMETSRAIGTLNFAKVEAWLATRYVASNAGVLSSNGMSQSTSEHRRLTYGKVTFVKTISESRPQQLCSVHLL